MNPKAILVLMVLFILLGSFAIFDPLRREEKEEAKKDLESHVVWLKDKKLESIKVAGANPTVLLECNLPDGCTFDGSSAWRMVEPAVDNADTSATASLASTILNLTHQEKIDFDSPPDQNEFGLERPQAQLTLHFKGEKEPVVLKFGKASAVGQNVYLSASTEPKRLFLVPSYLIGMVSKDPYHWRNKRLFPDSDPANVARLGWVAKKLEVRAIKINGTWLLEKPVEAKAGHLMLEALASSVMLANAKGMSPINRNSAEGKKIMSGKPDLEVVFSLANGTGHKIQLFARGAAGEDGSRELLAAIDNNSSLYILDSTHFSRFQKDILEYRERSVIDEATRAAVNSVRFTFPKEKRETNFKLESGNWAYESGEKHGEPVSQDRINAFLDSLRDSYFTGFYPLKGASPQAKAFKAQTADLYFELKDSEGKLLAKGSAVLFERKAGLFERDGDVRTLGEDFLKALPVRFLDLTESANKQLVVKPAEKEEADGHSGNTEHGHRH